MTTEYFKLELENQIERNVSIFEIRELIIAFKNEGGKQMQAYEILMGLHKESADKEYELEVISGLADFVVGFCSSHLKIWPASLNE